MGSRCEGCETASQKDHGQNASFLRILFTLFIQFEAVLNSRPLSSMSSEPKDLEPHTPDHFLIGTSLCSLPDTRTLANISNQKR